MEKEEVSHGEILEQVQKNTHAIRSLDGKLETIRKENEPVRHFVRDFDAAGRLARGFRALIGWIVVTGGFIAMMYIVIADAIKG